MCAIKLDKKFSYRRDSARCGWSHSRSKSSVVVPIDAAYNDFIIALNLCL